MHGWVSIVPAKYTSVYSLLTQKEFDVLPCKEWNGMALENLSNCCVDPDHLWMCFFRTCLEILQSKLSISVDILVSDIQIVRRVKQQKRA